MIKLVLDASEFCCQTLMSPYRLFAPVNWGKVKISMWLCHNDGYLGFFQEQNNFIFCPLRLIPLIVSLAEEGERCKEKTKQQ